MSASQAFITFSNDIHKILEHMGVEPEAPRITPARGPPLWEECDAQEAGEGSLVRAALGDIARARDMSQLARDTGLAREGLYKALSPEGNPEFATVMKVIKALGLKLGTHGA